MADKDDYLWDGSGDSDPEVQRLEGLLQQFRHEPHDVTFPAVVPSKPTQGLAWMLPALAVAAVLAIASVVGIYRLVKSPKSDQSAWVVSRAAGAPLIGNTVLGPKNAPLGAGQSLETDAQSRAEIHAERIGEIDVESNSRLRVISTKNGLKRAALDRGTIEAYIWAPPGEFVVETPAATTVDLGCAYTLHVDDSGSGTVKTMMGWVGFAKNGRESFIPAGAACSTRPKVGPGTPYFEDAPADLRAALQRFDFDDQTDDQRSHDLAVVLRAARPHDALTVWHLLSRVPPTQRDEVYDRLRELAPPPAVVTKEGISHLDQSMLDAWWNTLGFDNISAWRKFERAWPNEIH